MLFLFIGSMGLFFLLGGGSTPTSDEVSTNNRDIIDFPDIITDDVADNRLEAYNQATAILKQEEEERKKKEEEERLKKQKTKFLRSRAGIFLCKIAFLQIMLLLFLFKEGL